MILNITTDISRRLKIEYIKIISQFGLKYKK